MNTTQLRQIIKEAIVDRLKMIDEAGDKAALTAKINKIDEDINEAKQIKSAIPTNINHYVDPEIIGDLMEDMDNSIAELEAKKKELEDQLASLDKPAKEAKKKTKLKEFGPKPGLAKKQFMDALKEKGISVEEFMANFDKQSRGMKQLFDALPKSEKDALKK